MSKPRVLFVDDEPNVLQAVRRSLRNEFDVTVAESGRDALRVIGEGDPFAAVVCDCRMPEMDGIEVLQRIAAAAPSAVRLMLTGNIDQETAVRAVNAGEVFRFLTKPCDVDQLRSALQQAVQQHEIIVAEKRLLEQTLQGSIGVLADLLSVAKPAAFGRTARVRRKAREIADHLEGISAWELDAAALLSQIGCLNVDEVILVKLQDGGTLTDEQTAQFAAHAQFGADLIARIPRLDRVAAIIRYQHKNFDGSGFPRDGMKAAQLPLEARVLHGALVHDELHARGWSDAAIVDMLRKRPGTVDPAVVDALTKCADYPHDDKTETVLPNQLTLGMVLRQDVKTDQGVMLLCHGQEVTHAVLEHLLRFHRLGMLTERLLVVRPRGSRAGPARENALAQQRTA